VFSFQAGDAAAWFEAGGTLALFSVTLYQLRRDRKERIEDRRDVVDVKRRAQAELIDAWIEDIEIRPYSSSVLELIAGEQAGTLSEEIQAHLNQIRDGWPYLFHIVISNASSQAVRGLHVNIFRGDPTKPAGRHILTSHIEQTLPPTTTAGPQQRCTPVVGEDIDLRGPQWRLLDDFTVDLGFVDASGNHWERNYRGELRFIASAEEWEAAVSSM
jgi:hypothetical protein